MNVEDINSTTSPRLAFQNDLLADPPQNQLLTTVGYTPGWSHNVQQQIGARANEPERRFPATDHSKAIESELASTKAVPAEDVNARWTRMVGQLWLKTKNHK